jgi:hypothetical protein
MDNVCTLTDAVVARATELNLARDVTLNPPIMKNQSMWAADVASRMEANSHNSIGSADLPEAFVALQVDYHSILVGSLGTDPEPEMVADHLRRYHNQAAITWSWLGRQGEDLLLFLVGPPGSDYDESWKRAGREIERNERICRKLVWLPPATGNDHTSSLRMFLDRTFLARPWLQHPRTSQGELDRLAHLFSDITDGSFTEIEAKRWIDILSHDDDGRTDLAQRLVNALGENA